MRATRTPQTEVSGTAIGFAAGWSFRSWVAEGGYRWVRYSELGPHRADPQCVMEDDWVLTECDTSANRRYRAVYPLRDSPTLFREFADLPFGDRDAVRGFAARYGLLGQESDLDYPVERLSTNDEYPLTEVKDLYIRCDRQANWMKWPARVRVLQRLWTAVQGNRTDELHRILKWEKTDPGLCWVCRSDPVIDDAPEALGDIVYPDPTNGRSVRLWTGMEDRCDVGRLYLAHEISESLEYGGRYRVRFSLAESEAPIGFEIRPGCLLQAVWLQFGRSISGNKEQRRCKTCERWFELVPQDKGRKEFCSAPCKAKEYRDRKKRAVELKVAGQTPKQIAEATGTVLGTVKKWVGRTHRTRRKGS